MYLSVDLDYWKTLSRARAYLGEVFAHTHTGRALLVEDHHLLVSDADASSGPLWNVDRHSDFCGVMRERFVGYDADFHSLREMVRVGISSLNCGTWVDHVVWRREGEYVWYYPFGKHVYLHGRCDELTEGRRRPFVPGRHEWRRASCRRGLPHVFDSSLRVGISVSYSYLEGELPFLGDVLLGLCRPSMEITWPELDACFQKARSRLRSSKLKTRSRGKGKP